MFAAALVIIVLFSNQQLLAQVPGQVIPIDLVNGEASLFLDFSQLDYELVLFPTVQGESDTSRSFSYTVSGTSVLAKSTIPRAWKAEIRNTRASLEAILRQEESRLAARLRTRGGWLPPSAASKTSQPEQNTRTFTFNRFGNVTSDRTVRSTLVASNTRAVAYLDDSLAGADVKITRPDIQNILDKFSDTSYATITDIFGEPSDVDSNGKVVFLFTPLVDQVGGVAGFYSSGSLFSVSEGGNGNRSDMMFIGLSHELAFYAPLLAHEFQHLISFNQHALIRNGDSEESWLNEGLSHHTEDLVDGHIAGDLPRLYGPYLESPERFSLTGEAGENNGIRGAAYLFVRGLVETYGAGIAGRLVKTNRTGIRNVETETGEDFNALFQTHASRLFLSGTGLSTQNNLNYTLAFFTEPVSGLRSLPTPGEVGLSISSSPISGRSKPFAPSYIRLMGTDGEASVTIQTDPSGDFQGILIPIPRAFRPQLVLKVDYFPQLTFDQPLQGHFTAGAGITISGSVSDPAVSQILLSFTPVGNPEEETNFYFDVTNNRFNRSIIFDPSQAGDFVLQIYMGRQGEALPFVGRFSPVSVTEGSGVLHLPLDFFPGITLDASLRGSYRAGEHINLIGRTQDSTIEALSLFFTPEAGGPEIRVDTDIMDGRFEKGLIFFPNQAGTYNLEVFGGPRGGSLSFLGSFSPFVITSTGSEHVFIPPNGISGVSFDDPPPTSYFVGKNLRLSGTVIDPAINQLVIRFDGLEGAAGQIDFPMSVSGGRFVEESVSFLQSQTGTYELVVFGGQSGQSLPFLDSFKPVQVLSARPASLVRQESVDFGMLPAGQTSTNLVTIVNVGSLELTLSAISTDNNQFTGPAGVIGIAPGDSSLVRLLFRPAESGPTRGSLILETNDPLRRTLNVALEGVGVAVDSPSTVIAVPSLSPADSDADGDVDFADFIRFAGSFGSSRGDANYQVKFDLNGDDKIDFSDFVAFSREYGN
jgi:hypothetical protein